MAGGKAGFLDELTGDFVKYLRADTVVKSLIGENAESRIYPEMARQGQPTPFIVYTQSGGSSEKNITELDGCLDLVLHVYAYGDLPSISHRLAHAVADRMLPTQAIIGDGTKLYVCNGGVVDTGVESSLDGSDRKRFWTRLVFRMVIGD
jgi:hypothetical protein